MHAARVIKQQRIQRQQRAVAPPGSKSNLVTQSPMKEKDSGKTVPGSPGTESTITIRDEKSGWKSRTYSRNSSDDYSYNSYEKSDRKIEPVVWGKCFCIIGVVVTIIGLILLLFGMSDVFRPTPFVFGVFCTIAGILILMFGICFVKAANHWPEYNHGRVGSVFIISEETSKKDLESNNERLDEDMVKVLTVSSAPKLKFVRENKQDTGKELPGAVNRNNIHNDTI